MLTGMSLAGVWGTDVGRLPPTMETLVLTDDPAFVYALGEGLLRVIDARTGATLREHALSSLTSSGDRVLVSRSSSESVYVARGAGSDSVVYALSLRDGTMREVARLPWAIEAIDVLDGDARLFVDRGTLVDPSTGAVDRAIGRRWFSRDRTRCVREEIESATTVRLSLLDLATGVETPMATGQREARHAVFSDEGRTLWRVCLRSGVADNTALERWDVERRMRVMTRDLWPLDRLVATRSDGGDELVCTRDGGFGRPLDMIVRNEKKWSPVSPCVSPDGRRVAYSRRGVLCVGELTTGRETALSDAHTREVRSLSASRDGVAVAGSADGEMTVWRVATGELLWRLEGGAGVVTQVAISPDARSVYALVAETFEDYTGTRFRVWDLAQGVEVTPSPAMEFASTSRFVLSPDGTRALVTSGHSGHAPVWIDLVSWRDRSLSMQELFASRRVVDESEVDSYGTFDEANEAAWLVVRGPGADAWALTLDVVSGVVRARRAVPYVPSRLRAVHGTVVAEVRPRGPAAFGIRRYDLAPGPELPPCAVPSAGITVVALGPSEVAVGTETGAIHLYDGLSRDPIASTVASGRAVTALAFSPDGRTLFAGAADGRVRVYALDAVSAGAHPHE